MVQTVSAWLMRSPGALLLIVCLVVFSNIGLSNAVSSQGEEEFEVHVGGSAAAAHSSVGGDSSGDSSGDTTNSHQTFELGGELLQRIQDKLLLLGLSTSTAKHKERIQQIAVEEFQQWRQEEAQREALLQERQSAVQVPPQDAFPYYYDEEHGLLQLLVPPPLSSTLDGADYTEALEALRQNWTPPGGGRYEEYRLGTSPYILTEELLQTSDDIARLRRPYIQQAMKFAWNGYTKYAFGMDEIRPQSQRGSNHWGGLAVTLVDSLDTLWIMNMKEEFWQARDYVRDELSHHQNRKVSVFETTIRSLGGLLSAYDWSADTAFLDEALDLARRLMRAFDNNGHGNATVLPFGEVNLVTGHSNMIPWAGGNAILSEFGTLQLEFRYLDQVVQSKETKAFRNRVERIFEYLSEIAPNNGLYPTYMKTKKSSTTKTRTSRKTTHHIHEDNNDDVISKPHFSSDHFTFGALADSFYEYMLKIWLQGGKTEPMYRDMYDKAMQGMHDELLHISTPSGLTYLADKVGGKRIHHKMDHLVCFVGGMLALGAYTDPLGLESERAQRDLQTAKALTYTCYQMYARMNTGISPEYVEFVAGEDFRIGSIAPHYLLRPEAVESFYILNKLTGDPIFREWGWEVFQSIEKYCKGRVGYGSLGNVQDTKSPPRDEMESFFLAETLKYLYLLNDPDSDIDILNKHVFNTEAHPFRMFTLMEES